MTGVGPAGMRPTGGVLPAAVRSEWRKLRSVPSTLTIVVAAGLIVAVSALAAWQLVTAWETADPARRADLAAYHPEDGLLLFLQLCLAALGVLAVTSEYATGMIRTTFMAVPQRGSVLTAKAAVVGVVALLVGQTSVVAMFLLGRLVIGDRPFAAVTTPLAEQTPRLVGLGLSVLVVALVGLGMGVVTRSTAGALTVVAALLFVAPTMGQLLPEPWNARVRAVSLAQLPQELAGGPGTLLSPAGALLAMAAYVAVALTAAAVTLHRRDA